MAAPIKRRSTSSTPPLTDPPSATSQANLAVWYEPLAVGQPLPIMPLWLRGLGGLPVMLGQTYERTCQELRLDDVLT
jgi:hypothetical protein